MKTGMNDLTGLIPILYAALQVISRELVGIIPAAGRDFRADGVATGQVLRIPVTPVSENQDIIPGTPPVNGGDDLTYTDLTITKNRMSRPIVWNGDEEISVGNQLNGILVNQYTQAMRSIVNEVETDICAEAVQAALEQGNYYGTPGVTPFAANIRDFAQVIKIMDDIGAPVMQRQAVINTAAAANLRELDKLTSVAHSGTADLLRQGVIGEIMGFNIRQSAGLQLKTAGTAVNLTLDAAANPGDTILSVNALTGALNKGALITLNGERYVVKNNYAAGATQIAVGPAVIAGAATGATATVTSSYLPNVMFTPDFILAAIRAPAMPGAGDEAKDVIVITDPVSNLSFQVALYGSYRQTRVEIGLAWGQKAVNPRHGVVLLG